MQTQAGCQNFPETGFQVCGRFLEYWQQNGGLAQQGFPISGVFEEQNAPPPAGDGKVHKVQYFQRARFEEHLENQRPYDVLLGLLGVEQYKAKYGDIRPAPSVPGSADCQFFSETGHSVCGLFLQYWRNNGGLAQQGFPISVVFDELNQPPPAGDGQLHQVQYFQRARFEAHPQNQPPYNVLLGLLGAEQYRAKYANNPPAFLPPPAVAPPPPTQPPPAVSTPRPTTDDSYPCFVGQIKGNHNSGIYHMPGQRYYAITKNSSVRCYDTEAEAQAAGLRRSLV